MWTNFRDVRSMAEKISNVVAPPVHDDGDDDGDGGEHEEYEDDEEYDDDDEYVSEGEEGVEFEDDAESANRSPFNLVGMIARAMDPQPQQQPPHLDAPPTAIPERPHESQQPMSHHHGDPPEPTQQQQQQQQQQHEPQSQNSPSPYRHNPPESPAQQRPTVGASWSFSQPEATGMNDINLDTNNPNNDKTDDDDDDDESDREPPPPRLSLVRESGSVTPRHGRKTTLGSRLAQQQQQQQQQEEQPLRLQSPLKHSPVKHIIVLESSEEQRPVSMQHDQPLSTPPTPPMDSLLGTFPSVPLLLDDNDRGQSVPMPLPPPPPSHAEATNRPVHDKQQHRQTRRVDSGMSPKQIRGSSGGNTNASSSYKKSFFPSISLDSMEEDAQEEEEEKEHQHISIPNENNLVPKESISVLVSNTITPAVSNDASLRRSTSNEEYQNGATNVNPDDRRDVQGKEEQQQQQRIEKLEKRCKELKKLLGHAENHILELQQQNTNLADTSEHDRLLVQNHLAETEARLTQASTELRDQEVIAMRKECGDQIKAMERQLVEVRMSFEQDRHHLETLLAEAINRGKNAEELAREEKSSSDKSSSEAHQNQARALRLTEDKLVQAMAMLDERMESETNLKERIKALESKLSEQTAGAAESEQEMAALDTENENLHDLVEKLKVETLELRKQVANVEGDSDKLVHLRMELRMLKEDHNREKAKVQTVAASAETNTAQLESERDEALARAHDLQLQLSAALADIGVANSDTERVSAANSNLQSALEAFQNEREAEIAMMEENRGEQEAAMAAAHAAVLYATHEAHLTEIRHIQTATDNAIKHSMDEINSLEGKLEMMRLENVQTRRSLDEAIKRLQATQDDVIDRLFMKNVLLDWLTKTDVKERSKILELMASVLHFTDADKEKVHLEEGSALRKLVAPPPSKIDLEDLEGDNVREKWVNFLIAEAED